MSACQTISHKYSSSSSSSSSDGGGIFVCSGTAPPYSLLAERQPALHSRLRLRAVVAVV